MPPSARRGKRKASTDQPQGGPASQNGLTSPRTKARKASSNNDTNSLHSPSRTESSLENLPDELLLLILSHVYKNASPGVTQRLRRKVFYNLSLTSRRLNRAATDFLYEGWDNRIEYAQPFIQTLIANPQLSTCMKSVNWVASWPWRENPAAIPSSSCTRILRERLKAMDIPPADRASFLKDYTSNHLPDMLSLLLLFSPNIRELFLCDFSMGTSPAYKNKWPTSKRYCLPLLLNSVNGSLMGKVPSYQHLHTLFIQLGPNRVNDLYDVFRLPSLRKLTLHDIHASGVSDGSIKNPEVGFSPVEDLNCGMSYVASSVLADLILSCRTLKRFEYTYSSWNTGPNPHPVDYPSFSRALVQHKDTLEHIMLDDNSNRANPLIIMDDRGQLDSFRNFTNLRSLGVPFEAVPMEDDDKISDTPWDDDFSNFVPVKLAAFLPPSLNRLSFTVFRDEVRSRLCSDALYALHSKYRTDVPELSQIIVHVHESVYMRCLDFRDTKACFRASGVSFDLIQDGIVQGDGSSIDDEFEEELRLRSWWLAEQDSDLDEIGMYEDGFFDESDDDDADDDGDDDDDDDDDDSISYHPNTVVSLFVPPPPQPFNIFIHHHQLGEDEET